MLFILMFTGPLARFTVEGEEWILKHSGVISGPAQRMDLATWPMSTLFGLAAGLTLFTILSYGNRIRQIRLCIFIMLLSAGMIGIMFYYTWVVRGRLEGALLLYQWRFIIPPLAIILLYLGFRRIRRDELLVKAYDRIR